MWIRVYGFGRQTEFLHERTHSLQRLNFVLRRRGVIRELVADAHHRVERAHRALRDIGDALEPFLLNVLTGHRLTAVVVETVVDRPGRQPERETGVAVDDLHERTLAAA